MKLTMLVTWKEDREGEHGAGVSQREAEEEEEEGEGAAVQ